MSAARLGNVAAAELAGGGLRDLVAAMKARKAFETRQVEIMALEAAGMALLARGDRDGAVKTLAQAADIEEAMEPPSGPPGEQDTDSANQPAHELLGEVLLEIGRPADAAKQFAIGLRPHPQSSQTPPRRGPGRVQGQRSGHRAVAVPTVGESSGGGPDRPGLDEAKSFHGVILGTGRKVEAANLSLG
jgi:hypothetical protein